MKINRRDLKLFLWYFDFVCFIKRSAPGTKRILSRRSRRRVRIDLRRDA
jgi:hypothetical protein